MYQCIIFSSSFSSEETADDMFNEWIKEHPNIEIINFRYQQSRYGDHSICILYKEEKKNDI